MAARPNRKPRPAIPIPLNAPHLSDFSGRRQVGFTLLAFLTPLPAIVVVEAGDRRGGDAGGGAQGRPRPSPTGTSLRRRRSGSSPSRAAAFRTQQQHQLPGEQRHELHTASTVNSSTSRICLTTSHQLSLLPFSTGSGAC